VRLSASNPGSFAIGFVDANGEVQQSLVKAYPSDATANKVCINVGGSNVRIFSNLRSLVQSRTFANILKSPFQGDYLQESYFHGVMEKEEACKQLQKKPAGTFLVRFSSQKPHLAVTYVQDELGSMQHVMITRQNGVYQCMNQTFATLSLLVSAFQQQLQHAHTTTRAEVYKIRNEAIQDRRAEILSDLQEEGELVFLSKQETFPSGGSYGSFTSTSRHAPPSSYSIIPNILMGLGGLGYSGEDISGLGSLVKCPPSLQGGENVTYGSLHGTQRLPEDAQVGYGGLIPQSMGPSTLDNVNIGGEGYGSLGEPKQQGLGYGSLADIEKPAPMDLYGLQTSEYEQSSIGYGSLGMPAHVRFEEEESSLASLMASLSMEEEEELEQGRIRYAAMRS